MALKRNSSYSAPDDISHYMNTAGEDGGGVCFAHTASFTSNLDDPDNVVAYLADPSGKVFVGVNTNYVRNYDPTTVPANEQKSMEVVVGSKVHVKTGGWVETDMIYPNRLSSIVPGPAYLGMSGLFTDVNAPDHLAAGKFGSYADSDGYVKLHINADK